MADRRPPLVAADESLTHQIVDTFASVGQSDPTWTEKIWFTAHRRDGSAQVVAGLGKYTNRGVVDGFGAVAMGREQWAVRASRDLSAGVDRTGVGPLDYEILEPLRTVRFVLAPTEVSPISFDVTMTGALPPALEQGAPERSSDGYRVMQDVLRYHQAGTATGWLQVGGHRVELDGQTTVAFRDHSWGVRAAVGGPLPRMRPAGAGADRALLIWSPMLLTRPDGSDYVLFAFLVHRWTGGAVHLDVQGEEQTAEGSRRFVAIDHDLDVDPTTRRLRGGELRLRTAEGAERRITITAVDDAGFHLGQAGYFGYGGHFLGEWRGPDHVEADHHPDTTDPAAARRLRQVRDQLVRVEDHETGAVGFGNIEFQAVGLFLELGLTSEGAFGDEPTAILPHTDAPDEDHS